MKAQLYYMAYILQTSFSGKLTLSILIIFLIQYFLTDEVSADSINLEEAPNNKVPKILLIIASAVIIFLSVVWK